MTTLTRSLIDSARRIRATESGMMIDGEPDEDVSIGDPFPALLLAPASAEDDARGAERVTDEARLLYGPAVDLVADDHVEVTSSVYGDAIWMVVGRPEPYRRGRRTAGWTARLRRIS